MKNQKVERDFKGIWIPARLWEDPQLTMLEKGLLAEIDSLDCGEGCHASSAYLANFLGVCTGHVDNILAKLRKAGRIKTVKKGNHKRWLRVCKEVNQRPNFSLRSDLISRLGRNISSIYYDNKAICGSAKTRTPRTSFFNFDDQSFSAIMTKKYHKFAIKNRLLVGRKKPNLVNWQKAAINLLSQLDDDKARIKKVLRWYFENFRDDYVPQCYALTTFCEKFPQVEAARKRWGKAHPGHLGYYKKVRVRVPTPDGKSRVRYLDEWVDEA